MNMLAVMRLHFMSCRGVGMKPPKNKPFYGVYRKEGDICRQDDLLICQKRLNYHPGANVRYEPNQRFHFLKANCDGVVVFSREKCNLDQDIECVRVAYEHRNFENIEKITVNVIPRKMSSTFNLVEVKSATSLSIGASEKNHQKSGPSETNGGAGAGAPPLRVMPEAVAQLKKIAADGEFLRISVEGGGCSGFNYKLELDSQIDPSGEDVILELDKGATVVVDKLSLSFIRGSKVEFEQTLMRSAFRITDNPAATQGCSCGASFAPKGFDV